MPTSGHDERTAFHARKSEDNRGDSAGIPDYAHTLLSIALEVFLSLLTAERKRTVLTRRKTDMAVGVDEAGQCESPGKFCCILNGLRMPTPLRQPRILRIDAIR